MYLKWKGGQANFAPDNIVWGCDLQKVFFLQQNWLGWNGIPAPVRLIWPRIFGCSLKNLDAATFQEKDKQFDCFSSCIFIMTFQRKIYRKAHPPKIHWKASSRQPGGPSLAKSGNGCLPTLFGQPCLCSLRGIPFPPPLPPSFSPSCNTPCACHCRKVKKSNMFSCWKTYPDTQNFILFFEYANLATSQSYFTRRPFQSCRGEEKSYHCIETLLT